LALRAHQRSSREFPGWRLMEADLLGLVQALHNNKMWTESIPVMVEYLRQYSRKAVPVRLKLAQILAVEDHRPAQALKVLAKVDEAVLDDTQRQFLRKLRAKAERLHDADPYEPAEEEY
jgi:hypothetical protein